MVGSSGMPLILLGHVSHAVADIHPLAGTGDAGRLQEVRVGTPSIHVTRSGKCLRVWRNAGRVIIGPTASRFLPKLSQGRIIACRSRRPATTMGAVLVALVVSRRPTGVLV